MEIQWSLSIFTLLVGTGAWLFIFTGIDILGKRVETEKSTSIAMAASFILLVLGGIVSVTHLSHPMRMLAALNHPTSGIFMEALFIGLLCLAILIFLALRKRGANDTAVKAAMLVGMVFAVILAFSVGNSYIMAGRPSWNTLTLPIAYFLTAAASGASLRLIVLAVAEEPSKSLAWSGLMMGIAGVLSFFGALAFGLASGVFFGEFMIVYVGLALIVGGVVPAILGFAVYKRMGSPMTMAVSSLLAAIIGCLAFRSVMWLIGAAIDNFFGAVL